MRPSGAALRPWTEIFAVVFIFNILTYLNIVKNLEDWTTPHPSGANAAAGGFRSVAEFLRAPLFESINLTAWSWFTLMWIAFTAATLVVLARHRRRPVALIPPSWLGKGQLFYLMFLWLIVIANFTKALVAFADGRIATEGVIMFNALVCTVLILGWTPPAEQAPSAVEIDYNRSTRKAILATLLLLFTTTALYTAGVRALYGDRPTGWGGHNLRFGPNADWRVRPLLKSKEHE